MPRIKSNSTVTHRIELGVWERKLVEEKLLPTFIGKEIGETAASMVQALGAASAQTIGAYLALWGAWKTYPTLRDEMSEQWGNVKKAAGTAGALADQVVEQNTDEETGEVDKGGIIKTVTFLFNVLRL